MEHNRCLISGKTALKKLKGYEKSYLVKSPIGFVFCSRIPTEDELIKHYNSYPREVIISPFTIKRYNELLNNFEKYRKKGKILDVGCGVGSFLLEAKKRGWDVYGSEYTDEAIRKCEAEGIKMNKGKLNPSWFLAEEFDIITSFEVIEHINYPKAEIQNMHRLLRKGGLLYITTPNFNAIERFILRDKYSNIEYPEHLSYYTKHTLHYLLSRNGFKKLKMTSTGASLSHIRKGLSAKAESLSSYDSSDETIREKFEQNSILGYTKIAINSILNTLGVGNALKAWYIKV